MCSNAERSKICKPEREHDVGDVAVSMQTNVSPVGSLDRGGYLARFQMIPRAFVLPLMGEFSKFPPFPEVVDERSRHSQNEVGYEKGNALDKFCGLG